MLIKTTSFQPRMSTIILEEMVFEDHILRKINKVIDFQFIYSYIEDMYSDTARLSV